MRISAQRLGLGGAAILVAAGAFALLRPAPVPVEIGLAVRGPMQVTLDAQGETRVRDRYVVAAPVAGRVARIELREGDSVARGAEVARLFPAPLDARAREQAAAQVAATEDAQRWRHPPPLERPRRRARGPERHRPRRTGANGARGDDPCPRARVVPVPGPRRSP